MGSVLSAQMIEAERYTVRNVARQSAERMNFVYRSVDEARTDERAGVIGMVISRREPWRVDSIVSNPASAATRSLRTVGPMS